MIPQQVDLSRLKGILGEAKKVMKKVETGDYKTGNIDPRALTDEGINELYSNEEYTRPVSKTNSVITEEMVKNSRLPESIKQAFIENPIPQINMSNFGLDGLDDLIEEKELPKYQKRNIQSQPRIINESFSSNDDMITMSKKDLDNIITERINDLLFKKLSDTIVKEAVNNTIKVLIKEGKIISKK